MNAFTGSRLNGRLQTEKARRHTDDAVVDKSAAESGISSKADRPGFFGDVTAGGCADASLYRRFHATGLTELTCFPQLVAITSTFEPSRLADMEQRLLTTLTAEEAAEWREAIAPAKAAGTFFLASPHHCAVGTKPV